VGQLQIGKKASIISCVLSRVLTHSSIQLNASLSMQQVQLYQLVYLFCL
jgi:hypothetical protein